jgi:cytochrome d ubiquinol oxidase subunit I
MPFPITPRWRSVPLCSSSFAMYFAVFGTGVVYMLKLIGKGPEDHHPGDPGDALDGTPPNQRPSRPLSAAPDHVDPAVHIGKEP